MGVVFKNGKYLIDYRVKGRRIREVIGPNKRMAEQALAVRLSEIVQGRYKMARQGRETFAEFSKAYMEHSRANKRSWDRDVTLLSNLLPFFGKRQLSDITPHLIEGYKRQRLERVKPATVNREIALLKHMYNMAMLWEKASTNPMKGVKLLREENIPERVLTAEEISKLLDACTEKYSRPIVLTALHTGMRLNEILSLKWPQVDLAQRVITVLHSKNGKVRKIPINDTLFSMFAALRGKAVSEFVFIYYKTKGPVTVFRNAWLNALKRSGIAHARFHDLRHTFASNLVKAGVDLKTVMELLGHSTIIMTSRYAHSAPESKKAAVSVMDVVVGHKGGHFLDTCTKVEQKDSDKKKLQELAIKLVGPMRKRGRVVEGGGLENRSAARHQGFESSRFRHVAPCRAEVRRRRAPCFENPWCCRRQRGSAPAAELWSEAAAHPPQAENPLASANQPA